MKAPSNSDFITRKDLREELNVVKKEFKEELNVVKKDFNDGLNDLFERLDTANREYRDQILTQFSNFAGRVENLETENTVGAAQQARLKERVMDHEKRIRKLEKASN